MMKMEGKREPSRAKGRARGIERIIGLEVRGVRGIPRAMRRDLSLWRQGFESANERWPSLRHVREIQLYVL
jgi:hypothetical protein